GRRGNGRDRRARRRRGHPEPRRARGARAAARPRPAGAAPRAGAHRGARAHAGRLAARDRVPRPHRAAGVPGTGTNRAGIHRVAGGRPMTVTPVTATARPVSVARALRFELVKQLAPGRVRLLILACWTGPAVAVILVSGQGTLPSDTLFGRQMHATGWAGALAVLSFAGSWFFPLLTSVVAGDVFSSEDRLGTWRHLLVAVRSPRRIFLAKALASLAVLAVCVPGLAVSGIAGGLVAGNRALTGLDGHQLGPLDAAGKLLLAWLCALAPALAFAASGLLASVIFGRTPVGVLLPAFGGLGMQVAAQVLPMPAAAGVTLP